MNAINFVSFAVLVVHCFGAAAPETKKKLETVLDSMANDLLVMANRTVDRLDKKFDGYDSSDSSDEDTIANFYSVEYLSNIHRRHNQTLNAKRYVMESVDFWNDEDNLKNLAEAEKEKTRIEKLAMYIETLLDLVKEITLASSGNVFGACHQIATMKKNATPILCNMEVCKYQLQLVIEGLEVGESGAYLLKERLDLNAFADLMSEFEHRANVFLFGRDSDNTGPNPR